MITVQIASHGNGLKGFALTHRPMALTYAYVMMTHRKPIRLKLGMRKPAR